MKIVFMTLVVFFILLLAAKSAIKAMINYIDGGDSEEKESN
jgi:Tfp pilus assembly protein PilO